MPAQYFCSGEHAQEDWHHYGLAAPIYTHFTSPIRRYADVCVHRLLGAAIGVAPLPTFLMDKVRVLSRASKSAAVCDYPECTLGSKGRDLTCATPAIAVAGTLA